MGIYSYINGEVMMFEMRFPDPVVSLPEFALAGRRPDDICRAAIHGGAQ